MSNKKQPPKKVSEEISQSAEEKENELLLQLLEQTSKMEKLLVSTEARLSDLESENNNLRRNEAELRQKLIEINKSIPKDLKKGVDHRHEMHSANNEAERVAAIRDKHDRAGFLPKVTELIKKHKSFPKVKMTRIDA